MGTKNSASGSQLLMAFQQQNEIMARVLADQQKYRQAPGISKHPSLLGQLILSQQAAVATLMSFALDRDDIEPEWRELLTQSLALQKSTIDDTTLVLLGITAPQ